MGLDCNRLECCWEMLQGGRQRAQRAGGPGAGLADARLHCGEDRRGGRPHAHPDPQALHRHPARGAESMLLPTFANSLADCSLLVKTRS